MGSLWPIIGILSDVIGLHSDAANSHSVQQPTINGCKGNH